MYGIVNASSESYEIDECEALIHLADEHSLKVIVVGADYDMESKLMKKLVASGRFEIFKQSSIERAAKNDHKHQSGSGPRNRWGALK